MKNLIILLFLFSTQFCFAQSDSYKSVPEEKIYEFLNFFVEWDGTKRIKQKPSDYKFRDTAEVSNDTTFISKVNLSGADLFFYWMRFEYDSTTIKLLDSADWEFLRFQIQDSVVKLWDKKKMKNCKVIKGNKFIPINYPVSIPLFSVDHKKVIIYSNYYGMSRTYFFIFDSKENTWKQIDVWQDGT